MGLRLTRLGGFDYYEHIGVSFELSSFGKYYQKLIDLENLRFFPSLYGRSTADPMQLPDARAWSKLFTPEWFGTPRACRCGSRSPGP